MPTDSYTTAGTFTWICPAGVTHVKAEVWGGGAGSSGSGGVGGGSAGAGGAYAVKDVVTVAPGTGYTVVVGDGGPGGAGQAMYSYGYNNGAGGDSYFITIGTVMAKGGPANTKTAAPASSSVGDRKFAGGNGGSNVTNPCGAGGGSSGGTASTGANGNNSPQNCTGGLGGTAPSGGGNGGRGGVASTNANNSAGFQPGGGGGGPCRGGPPGRTGTNGGVGQVLLTYTAASVLQPAEIVHAPGLDPPTVLTPAVAVLQPADVARTPALDPPTIANAPPATISPGEIVRTPGLDPPTVLTPAVAVLQPADVARTPGLDPPTVLTPAVAVLQPAEVARTPGLDPPTIANALPATVSPGQIVHAPTLEAPTVLTTDFLSPDAIPVSLTSVVMPPWVITTDLLIPEPFQIARAPVLSPPVVITTAGGNLHPTRILRTPTFYPVRVSNGLDLLSPDAIPASTALPGPSLDNDALANCWAMSYDHYAGLWILTGAKGSLKYTLSKRFKCGASNRFDRVLLNLLGGTPPPYIDVVPMTRAKCNCTDPGEYCWKMSYDTVNHRWLLDGGNGYVVYATTAPFQCHGGNTFDALVSTTAPPGTVLPPSVQVNPYADSKCNCADLCAEVCSNKLLCAQWLGSFMASNPLVPGGNPVKWVMHHCRHSWVSSLLGVLLPYTIQPIVVPFGFKVAPRIVIYCWALDNKLHCDICPGAVSAAGDAWISFGAGYQSGPARWLSAECDSLSLAFDFPQIAPVWGLPSTIGFTADLTACPGLHYPGTPKYFTCANPGDLFECGEPTHPVRKALPCVHLGDDTGQRVPCKTCRGKVMIKTFACGLHGTCSIEKPLGGTYCCATCPDYQPRPPSSETDPSSR